MSSTVYASILSVALLLQADASEDTDRTVPHLLITNHHLCALTSFPSSHSIISVTGLSHCFVSFFPPLLSLSLLSLSLSLSVSCYTDLGHSAVSLFSSFTQQLSAGRFLLLSLVLLQVFSC